MYRWPDNHERISLPIDEKLTSILGLLKQNQVVVCEAETGAGKTTRIGQAAILADPNLRVFMTQTRRNACRWNGQRIASELHCKPGQLVGWRLSNEIPMISAETRLELMIDQSLVQKIRREKALPKGLIIIDEAHERSLSIDLLLGLIKQQLSFSPETNILIVSATIDTKKFSAFFNQAPIIHVKGQCHPVTTELVNLQHGEHHTDGAIRAACGLITRFLRREITVYDSNKRPVVITKGTVLILLPGKEDINIALERLHTEAINQRANEHIELFACHGESPAEEQNLVQKPVPSNTLRFVCGTEVLRSSVTITETIGVIDSLQIKRLITHPNGIGELTKISVSKAEADQAKGRAGRTAPGFYMPISYNSEYIELSPWPEPAIVREPLAQLVLQIAAINCSIRNFAFIDAPILEKLEVTIDRLKVLGALAEDNSITKMGEELVNLPLTPELAKVLITANKLGVLPEAIIITAAMEAEGIFQLAKLESIEVDENYLKKLLPFIQVEPDNLPIWITKKDNNVWEISCKHPPFPHSKGIKWLFNLLRKSWAGESQSDFIAIVTAYREFCSKRKTLKKHNEKELINWCKIRGLNYKRICQAEDKMKQICEALRLSSALRVEYTDLSNQRTYDEIALSKALISAKIDEIAFQSNLSTKEFLGKIGNFNLAFESICPPNSQIILINGLNKVATQIRGQTRHRLLATHAAPLDPSWIIEMLPHLCTKKRLEDYQYNITRAVFVETEDIYFQSRLLVSNLVTPDFRQLARWLANQCDVSDTSFNNLQTRLVSLPKNYSITPPAKDPCAKIMESNHVRQQQAQQLNNRANQKIFKVFTKEELAQFFESKLVAASKTDIIISLESLLLPPLEEGLAHRITIENPDKILINDIECQVEYSLLPSHSVTAAPRISFPLEYLQTVQGRKLFTSAIKLPGGRFIEVAFGNKFILKWNIHGKVDLSYADLAELNLVQLDLRNATISNANLKKTNFINTNLKGANLSDALLDETLFVEDSIFFRFSAKSSELNHMPCFLSRTELGNREAAACAFNRLLKYKLTPSQLEYIKWSIVMQFIDEANNNNVVTDLKWLKQHPILTHSEFSLHLIRNIASLFTSAMSFFGSTAKTETFGEQAMQEKIQESIEIIERKPGLNGFNTSKPFLPNLPN